MLRMVDWSKITPKNFQNYPPGPARPARAQIWKSLAETFSKTFGPISTKFSHDICIINVQVRFTFWTKICKIAYFTGKKLIWGKKNPKKGWKWTKSGRITKILKPHLQNNNSEISWKFQVKWAINSKNILRKEKNKPKIYGFPFPGVTFLMDHWIFYGTKFQVWQNVLAKWFLFLSYIKKMKKNILSDRFYPFLRF